MVRLNFFENLSMLLLPYHQVFWRFSLFKFGTLLLPSLFLFWSYWLVFTSGFRTLFVNIFPFFSCRRVLFLFLLTPLHESMTYLFPFVLVDPLFLNSYMTVWIFLFRSFITPPPSYVFLLPFGSPPTSSSWADPNTQDFSVI